MVNAWRLYNDNVKKITFNDFKIEIVESLIFYERSFTPTTTRHKLEELAGPKASTRKKCIACYKELSKKEGWQYANARKINTRCSSCQKPYCLHCFQLYHKKCGN